MYFCANWKTFRSRLIIHYSLFIALLTSSHQNIVKISRNNIKKTHLSDNLNIFAIDKSPKRNCNLHDCIHFTMTINWLCTLKLL